MVRSCAFTRHEEAGFGTYSIQYKASNAFVFARTFGFWETAVPKLRTETTDPANVQEPTIVPVTAAILHG